MKSEVLNAKRLIKRVRIDRLSLKLTNILATLLIVLFLSCFVAQGVNAEQVLLTDNFTTDQSLNSSLWQTNGVYGSLLCNAIRSAIAVPSFALVNTDPSFSSAGMCINSVNNPYQMSSLETVRFFFNSNYRAGSGCGNSKRRNSFRHVDRQHR